MHLRDLGLDVADLSRRRAATGVMELPGGLLQQPTGILQFVAPKRFCRLPLDVLGLLEQLLRPYGRILSCIPEQKADLLRLRYLEGASADDLATRLGIPVNAVDQRTTRAKRLLREKLAEQPDLVEELYADHPRLY